MKINKSFTKIILGLLLTCLLTLGVSGRLVGVSALAEVAPELAPVFDTQIYQLQDYIDHGGMTEPQLDIFYTLAGLYAMGQMGSEKYQLTNPYSTQEGVLNWLKDIGIETYNTLIGLTPDTVALPDGSIMSTDAIKKAASLYVANLMGCALKAYDYESFEDFENDIDTSEHYFIPWNRNTQYGLNTMFQTYGGIYQWQFDTMPFSSDVSYRSSTISPTSTYWTYYNQLSSPIVRFNYMSSNTVKNIVGGSSFFSTYKNLFLNTTTGKVLIVNDSGDSFSGNFIINMVLTNNTSVEHNNYNVSFNSIIAIPPADTYVQAVRDIYNNSSLSIFSGVSFYAYLEDFIDHVFVGSSWATRGEIFNVTDLNLAENDNQFYVTTPSDDDYYFDLKGILQDILNNTNLYNIFIDNIYTPEGVLVHDTDLIRISTDIYDILNQQNPPIPVNLNDLVEVTDNDYIDILKEHAEDASNVLGLLVSAAHNIDYEFLYIILGTSLFTLICALLGKMGK